MAKITQGTVFMSSGDAGRPTAGFGRSTDHPIPASSGRSSYRYLKHLHPKEGGDFIAERCATYKQPNRHIIDAWRLTKENDPKDEGFLIFIDCYAGENSTQAPEGCKLDFSWFFLSLL